MPFCKACFDAGKPLAEYSTHYVRNRPGGDVVCPTILNQQCKYCKKNGHTPKHCPELKGKYMPEGNRKPEDGMRKPEDGKRKPEDGMRKPEGKSFKSLAMEKDALHDNFPMIGEKSGGRIIRPTPMKLNVWAEVVKKAKAPAQAPQAQEEQAQEEQAQEEQAQEEQAPEAQAPEAQAPEAQAPEAQALEEQEPVYIPQDYSKGSWADL